MFFIDFGGFLARKWQITAFIFTILPAIMSMYVAVEIYSLFIPITGRIGANRNPEMIVGLLTVLVLLLIVSHYVSITIFMRELVLLT